MEIPPQIPLLDASDVSRQERFFHSLKTQRVCPVSPALKALLEDRFTGSVPHPLFLKRKALRFLLGERPQVALLDVSEVSRQERYQLHIFTQRVCPASPALKALREDRYYWIPATPPFFCKRT